MANNLGKLFEEKFRTSWRKQFPNSFIYRLPDQQSGYSGGGAQNPCDFFCFDGNILLMVECKAHSGASIPLTAIPQYERLLKFKGQQNVFPGILVWLYEKDKVFWIPIEELEKIVSDNKKSIGLKTMDEDKYEIIDIPSEKLRTFMDSDFKYLVNKLKGGNN